MRVQLLLLFVASVISLVVSHDGRHDPRLQKLLDDVEDRDLTLESRAEAQKPHHARSAHHRDFDDDDDDDLSLESREEAQKPHHARSAHHRDFDDDDDDDLTLESYLRRPLYKHFDYDDDDDDDDRDATVESRADNGKPGAKPPHHRDLSDEDRDATVESRAGSGKPGAKQPHHRDFSDEDRDATVESRADAKKPHHTRRQHHKLSESHKRQHHLRRHKLHGLHLHHLQNKHPRFSDGSSESLEHGRQHHYQAEDRDVTVESRADDVKHVHHKRRYNVGRNIHG